MANLKVLEQFLNGEHPPVACATEKDYYRLWHDRGIGCLAPTDSAILGSLLADRLPWVFTAGYQATLRNAFPSLPSAGWAAFAATEDTQNPEAHPGTTLSDNGKGYLLNGHKSWIAHADVVDHLIVTVNDPGGNKRRARGLIIERGRTGMTLTQREQPGFLGAMSQGFARFEDTPIDQSEVFEFEAIRQFGRTEAKFVMLASAAFMLASLNAQSKLRGPLFAVSAAIVTLLGEHETSRQVYAKIDTAFQCCVDLFESEVDITGIAGYGSDRRLFRMYTDRIQRRAGYAAEEALGGAN